MNNKKQQVGFEPRESLLMFLSFFSTSILNKASFLRHYCCFSGGLQTSGLFPVAGYKNFSTVAQDHFSPQVDQVWSLPLTERDTIRIFQNKTEWKMQWLLRELQKWQNIILWLGKISIGWNCLGIQSLCIPKPFASVYLRYWIHPHRVTSWPKWEERNSPHVLVRATKLLNSFKKEKKKIKKTV